MPDHPAQIRPLPDTLVNQIAAGEVVERPASVVKELVENALDAGARRIEIDLEEGGVRLVRIRDDGGGIPPDELALAVSRHATSKIASIEDLEQVATLGFRGEALPSIASVSRFTATSRPPGADSAWSLAIEAGRKGAPMPAAHPPGTRIEVRDLFFATPARLKFLKDPRVEMGHVGDAIRRLAMAHPTIGFRLTDEDRTILDYPPLQSTLIADGEDSAQLERLAAVMGREFAQNALLMA